MTKVIAKYRIPFDIDQLTNGGCGGRDILPDSYGEKVTLLISDTGSAYICPEDTGGRLRSYIDRSGSERWIEAFPGSIDRKGWRLERWPSFYDIFLCARKSGIKIERSVSVAPAGEHRGAGEVPRLPTMYRGLSFYADNWHFSFDDDFVRAESSIGDYFFTEYRVDKDGIVWKEKGDIATDSEGDYQTKRTTMAESNEFNLAIKNMERGISCIIKTEEEAANAALRVFKSAALMLEEIEMFEKRCREGR